MTPGEQTRDYYRKQGRLEAQVRILELLKRANCKLDGAHHSENLCDSPHHLGTLIAEIRGGA